MYIWQSPAHVQSVQARINQFCQTAGHIYVLVSCPCRSVLLEQTEIDAGCWIVCCFLSTSNCRGAKLPAQNVLSAQSFRMPFLYTRLSCHLKQRTLQEHPRRALPTRDTGWRGNWVPGEPCAATQYNASESFLPAGKRC